MFLENEGMIIMSETWVRWTVGWVVGWLDSVAFFLKLCVLLFAGDLV